MEISYWKSRWRKNNIGWHMDEVYPQLPEIWPLLSLKSNPRVLVPLCGKSTDMSWLAQQGCHVIGVEVSEKALQDFINSQPEEFFQESSHGFSIYKSKSFELWKGDFLKLPINKIAAPDLIYDKASIVAFPLNMRKPYANKILQLCGNHTQMLLQTFEYNQAEMNGPPFSVPEKEVNNFYEQRFQIKLVYEQSRLDEVDKFQQRGLWSYFTEKIYHLKPFFKQQVTF